MGFLVLHKVVQPSAHLIPEHFFTWKEPPNPLVVMTYPNPFPVLGNHQSFCLCVFLSNPDILHKWDQYAIVPGFFHFVWDPQGFIPFHGVFKVFHFVAWINGSVIKRINDHYGWIKFHFLDIPHFIYPFFSWWRFGLFPLRATMNNIHMVLWIVQYHSAVGCY